MSRFPKGERDKDLPSKLEAEWPAILRWMVNGSAAWRMDGLNPPKAVIDATNLYLDAEDSIATWIEERCEVKDSTPTRRQVFSGLGSPGRTSWESKPAAARRLARSYRGEGWCLTGKELETPATRLASISESGLYPRKRRRTIVIVGTEINLTIADIIAEAARHGVTMSIEDGRLACTQKPSLRMIFLGKFMITPPRSSVILSEKSL